MRAAQEIGAAAHRSRLAALVATLPIERIVRTQAMRASATVVALLLLAPLPALAQNEPSAGEQTAMRAEMQARIRGLEAALGRINAEQQSVYQQFQMVQEMRRNEWQEVTNPPQVYTPPTTPPNYDDVVRDKQAREQRLQSYSAQMDRLYARYRELEQQKQPLLDELAAVNAQR